MGHPTLGRRRRRHKVHPQYRVHRCYQFLDWQTTWIQTLVLLTRKVEKKRSDRSQSRLLLSLLPADPQTSMMRLWESLKWIRGKLKGLRRGLNRNSEMLKKNYQKCLVINLIQDMCLVLHGGYGSSSLQECLDILNQAGETIPLLPATLG